MATLALVLGFKLTGVKSCPHVFGSEDLALEMVGSSKAHLSTSLGF